MEQGNGATHMEASTVFYSWQTDLPNATNRSFIEKALEAAARKIRDDDSIKVEPVVDRDTAGVPGAPDIAETIFAKIRQAQVVVCDVSIINQGGPRATPNPNVLIELGYAIKASGLEQIIMVMNVAYGRPELLPFDLRMKRVITYHMPEDIEDRATERKKLEAAFEQGLRIVFMNLERKTREAASPPQSIADQTQAAIEASQPNQAYLVSRFMKESVIGQIAAYAPGFPDPGQGEPDDILVQAINQTDRLALEFARVADVIAHMNAVESARALYNGFARLLEYYRPPPGYSGRSSSAQPDYYKFMGHELFVMFLSSLIRTNRWELIADLLDGGLYVENTDSGRPEVLPFDYLSGYVELLERRNKRLQSQRISLHAAILNQRHTNGDLAAAVPMREFVGADLFLFLRDGLEWRPWSALYLGRQLPRYLIEATRATYAQQLLRPLKVENIEALRNLLPARSRMLIQLFGHSREFYVFSEFDPQQVGSR